MVQLVIEYMNGKLPVCVKGGYDFVDVRDVAAGCLLAAPWIGSFSRICGKRALYTRYSLHTLTSNSNFSSSKARTGLGYFSRPADDTIRDMTGWIMEN